MPDATDPAFLQMQIATLRTLLGSERFDQSEPGHTLRADTTAALNPSDMATLKSPLADPDRPLKSDGLPADPAQSLKRDGLAARPTCDGFASSTEYTLRDRVGKGGMGEIFLAGQNGLRREVAIKKIIPEHLEKSSAKATEEAFVSEALVTGFLDHPNIVPVHALGRDEAEPLYTIAFQAGDLWSEAAGRRDRVFVDLWESYLER